MHVHQIPKRAMAKPTFLLNAMLIVLEYHYEGSFIYIHFSMLVWFHKNTYLYLSTFSNRKKNHFY